MLDAGQVRTAINLPERPISNEIHCFRLFCLHLGRAGTVPDRDVTGGKPSLSNSGEFEPWTPGRDGPAEHFGAHARIASTAHYMTDHLSLVLHALDLL